ncbi:MAG: DUF927 domain-containing protein [Faecalibacterium sp.]
MAVREINLDEVVNYRAEYTAAVQRFKITGDNLVGLCPFHKEKNPSFSVDLKTGKWHCFTEGRGGNFISFWAELHGVDTQEAYKQILEKYGVSAESPKRAKKEKNDSLESFTLSDYAFQKRLPEEWLSKDFHLETRKDRNNGASWLYIPYYDVDGAEATYRKRYANKRFFWRTGSAGKICLYAEWRIQECVDIGFAVIVEGESDTQTLWHMGIPAIGVPGASMFRPEWASKLQGLKLYLHHEPDGGGDTFIHKICTGLRDGGYEGEVFEWSCKALGEKDPSDLYIKHGVEQAAKMIWGALKTAKSLDYKKEDIPEAVSGSPILLRQPEGWEYSEKGISRIDEKKMQPVLCCRTPILLTKRLQSIETGEEKIEVAFKRDGQWQTAIYPRSTVFQSRSITVMADLGCTITSENSKQVVRFLGALEAENIDIIPKEDSTSTFGWQPGNRFVPGHSDGITLDIDPSQRSMATAYCQNGTFERWIGHMAPHRARNKFRFILAASFAAPLLRIVKQRIFFVYNWGGSKGGKTAALKAALSAWGDPERLMVNFNATQVGLERTAAFYCDLPLGIDERQLAGNNQGALEKIVYMIASGTGKIRGAKSGGIQATQQWRTVALATGEEPLSTETTQTGVSTRVLELYGGPFDNERDAGLMHQQAVMDCGWAGPAFVERIISTPEWVICDAFEQMQSYVHAMANGKNGSHISGISAVALADAMIDGWFFSQHQSDPPSEVDALQRLGISQQSWSRAKMMAASILEEQVANNSTDVNENATQFILDWVMSNKAYFGSNAVGTCLGMMSESGNTAYIFPSMLNQALTKAGYSPRKTMKYLADQQLISVYREKNGKVTYSTMHRFGDRSCRFVEFSIGKLAESEDPMDNLEAQMDGEPQGDSVAQVSIDDGFTALDDTEDLPF